MSAWFWLVVAIAAVLFLLLCAGIAWFIHFTSHFFDGF